MTDIVPADRIEQIVGARRHMDRHIGRAVTSEETVYILHSADCKESTADLRDCPYSLALDQGIDLSDWLENAPVELEVRGGRLLGHTAWKDC